MEAKLSINLYNIFLKFLINLTPSCKIVDIGAPAEAANERIARLQAELGHLGGVDERPQASGWFDTYIAYCGNVNFSTLLFLILMLYKPID